VASVGGTIGGGVPTQLKQKNDLSSVFMAIAVILFIVSALGLGGALFWKYYSKQQNVTYKEQLAKKEKEYNIDLIQTLKVAGAQIDMANKLIANHVAFSKIFDHIGKMAISDVRFLNMDLKSSDSQKVTVSVKGLGKNLPAVAFQSDVLADLAKYGVKTIFSNPVIQSPSLDAVGAISFGFSADVDRNSLLFKSPEQNK
jgi:phosphate/sulfate permease